MNKTAHKKTATSQDNTDVFAQNRKDLIFDVGCAAVLTTAVGAAAVVSGSILASFITVGFGLAGMDRLTSLRRLKKDDVCRNADIKVDDKDNPPTP